MKKYKIICGLAKFECDCYVIHPTCIEFLECGDENYIKIIPTNAVITIYQIEKNKSLNR